MATSDSVREIDDLEELADIISSSAKTIKTFFRQNDIPDLSFDKNAPLGFPHSAPPNMQEARRKLLDASKKINQLVMGAIDHIIWYSGCFNDSGCLRYICYHDIAGAIPMDSDISYADLAEKTKTNEDITRRALRFLMTSNLFCEPRPGYVAHTVGSKTLTIPGPGDMVTYASIECLPMAANMVETIEKFGYSEEPNETAYNFAYNTTTPVFLNWANDPIRGPRFARAMTSLQSTPGHSIDHVLKGFDWASLPSGSTVVDIGGSVGACDKAIAKLAPNTKFVVQDLSSTIKEAESSPLPPELKDQITYQIHDFFTPEPVQGADVYFLRFILHDYSDKYVKKILSNIIPAMKPGHSRLVVMDSIMTPVGTISPSEERIMRFMDVMMLILLNAKEREMSEWERLFNEASGGKLKVANVKIPEGSAMGVMELTLEE